MESLQKEKQTVVNSLSSLQVSKPRFMSLSLPNSANSSPLLTSKRKPKGEVAESPSQDSNLTLKQQYMLQEIIFRKSKSCGEGRASLSPFDEFDHWLIKPNTAEHDNTNHESLFVDETIKESHASDNELETIADGGFKCSALCMYLPGFGKAKSVKPKKEGLEMEGTISRTVSLEKFECGSWSSSKIFNDIERDNTSSYFDLPLELINGNITNDVHSPITSAFVFEKNLKGVLKNGSSKPNGRKSDTSPHQVRFSMSSSTPRYPPSPVSCNTPSLIKAKDDFNAFLEANST
ncbi:uncharacterized protein LOC127136907 [Lathyrus oleraceus]|uniref:uncharacterized protein LOC127136907 n=1 Tax=Pisum sativum TaxID=3888 RepID=UPI001FC5480F|nr:uncharacterized protein LOC127136907 [Pisum sativum]